MHDLRCSSARAVLASIAASVLFPAGLVADGAADNAAERVRPVPPPGIAVPAEKRKGLEEGLEPLREAIRGLEKDAAPARRELLPDVRIYEKAVGDALRYGEIFREEECEKARTLLAEGLERAQSLARGQPGWPAQTGLVVRGYLSRIDGSVQPYGLVVPPSYSAVGTDRFRLDVWLHGRDEKLSELNFLDGRRRDPGLFTPRDTIVLHPYGRYCNAFKLAGEVDVLEAIDSVRSRYRVDEDRVAIRGFSMGGAGAWHLAVHYADRWFAANPGAGFSETPDFLKVFQKEKLGPEPWEKTLWALYDCPGWTPNLLHCPTVAYSGEVDSQRQAAAVMARAFEDEGMALRHVIGPGTAHQYHSRSKEEVEAALGEIARQGRERMPREVHLATYTLRYNRMHWVSVEGLGQHWKRARIDAAVEDGRTLRVHAENATALRFEFPAGSSPLDPRNPCLLRIDGEELVGPRPLSDRSFLAEARLEGGRWQVGPPPEGLRKAPGLQGPIDDAFLDRFLFVRPTGKCAHPAVESFVKSEMGRAIERWRRQMRGEARVMDDSAVGDQDIAFSNLVLWGDPASNALLGRIVERLPIRWSAEEIAAGERRFPAAEHALVLIYPNPLNPRRYVVLNSGFTYREYDDLNNARQVPKLPDWAVIDLRTPPSSRWPGKVVAADFFGERWELKPAPAAGP